MGQIKGKAWDPARQKMHRKGKTLKERQFRRKTMRDISKLEKDMKKKKSKKKPKKANKEKKGKKRQKEIHLGGSYTPYGSKSGYHTKIKRSGKPKHQRVK